MESLKLSYQAIAPIFILMLLGYVLKVLKVTDKRGFDAVNKLVFKVFLPVLLFYNIYTTDISRTFDAKLITFTVIGIFAVFFFGYFIVLGLSRENAKRGVMLQGLFRTNFAILGVPLIGYICGDSSKGMASLMVAIVVPIFNVLAVIALESFRGGRTQVNILKIIKGVLTNPLIIGCVIGILFQVYNIKLPALVERSVSEVSSVATPLAIIALGAGFEFSGIGGYAREITIVMIARLVIIPAVMIAAAVLCGFSGEAIACLLITFGGPIAVSSFVMSQQMGGDEKLSAQLIVISSALCLLTLFLWILALNYLEIL